MGLTPLSQKTRWALWYQYIYFPCHLIVLFSLKDRSSRAARKMGKERNRGYSLPPLTLVAPSWGLGLLPHKKEGVLVRRFEKTPSVLPRSCFLGVAWNFCSPRGTNSCITHRHINSCHTFSPQHPKPQKLQLWPWHQNFFNPYSYNKHYLFFIWGPFPHGLPEVSGYVTGQN